jgi:YihY family inner membrane protein
MRRRSRLFELVRRLPMLSSAAAEMAFYFALSLVPFLGLTAVAAVAWLPPLVGQPLAETLIHVFAPEAGLDAPAISRWVRSMHSSGWLAAGIVLASWASFRFMSAGVEALTRIADVKLEGWRDRLRSAGSAAFLVVVWMLALLLLAFVVLVAPALEGTLDQGGWFAGQVPTEATLSRLLAVPVLLLAIVLTYRAIPGLRARGLRLWLMSSAATVGWTAAGWAVTQVLPSLWRGRALYGALGSFVLFLLWSYTNAWVLLLAGQLSALWPGRDARGAGSV